MGVSPGGNHINTQSNASMNQSISNQQSNNNMSNGNYGQGNYSGVSKLGSNNLGENGMSTTDLGMGGEDGRNSPAGTTGGGSLLGGGDEYTLKARALYSCKYFQIYY